MEFWNQKTFCLITGASRGIGKTIAVEFGKKVGPGSVLLLVARSAKALEETKAEVLQSSEGVKVVTAALDLGKLEVSDFLHFINSAFITSGSKVEEFDHALLVHNAGSLGNIALKGIQLEDIKELREFYDFNVFSLILLTSQFFKVFNDPTKQRSIVQISTLGAIQPIKTWSLYCTSKAGRDMFMKCIAAEDPSISTINYAPGPVDTEMYNIASTKTGDPETLKLFKESKEKGQILTPIQTIMKLVRILGEKKYTKGEHVDYYDIKD